jgi:DNA replication regulator DPB11
VIICNTSEPNEHKLKFATDRRIPAVHATWLWDCIRHGQQQPYSKYQINNTASPRPQKTKLVAKPQAPAEIPTVRLSTGESFELRQKKAQHVKKPTRQAPQQPRGLNLAPSADPTPESTIDSLARPTTGANDPALAQDEASIPGLDGHASFPLQDISANSPRRRPSTTSLDSKSRSRQRSSSAESLIRPATTLRKARLAKEPTPDSVIPADPEPAAPLPQEPPEEKDYSDILAQLRANRKQLPSPADANDSTRRRGRRQLGRAPSTRSTGSAADSSGQLNLDGTDDKEQAQEYQPSQELGWDSPGAAQAREQMIKRLGGRVTEQSVRVEGIGIVRDVASENAGSRAPRKRREKGF